MTKTIKFILCFEAGFVMRKGLSASLISSIGVGSCCASANLSIPKAGVDESQLVKNKENFCGKNEKISGGSDTQNKKPWWRFGFIPDWFKAAWWEVDFAWYLFRLGVLLIGYLWWK